MDTQKADKQRADLFITINGKYFESHQIIQIKKQLLQADDSKWNMIESLQFKDPNTILIISLLVGVLGIDRFMIGDTGLGVGKLLTCGGFGLWTIIDWFMIVDATKEKNISALRQTLY